MVQQPKSPLTEFRRGTVEYCVLALLRDEPRYALDLIRALSEADGLLTSEGTLYPLLSRLRRDGLVETTWGESPSGPPRRYYTITAEGRGALARFTADWEKFTATVSSLLRTGGANNVSERRVGEPVSA